MAGCLRRWVFLILAAAAVAQGRGSGIVRTDTERYRRMQMTWGGKLPSATEPEAEPRPGEPRRKPLLLYIPSSIATRDQERFEEVVLRDEAFIVAARFFECIEVPEGTALTHPLFEGLRWKAPAVIVMDSSRRKRKVARARASAMKAVGLMRSIGQPDYVTDINETIRKARLLLGDFDRCDAARDALKIKRARVANARGKGDQARARVLEEDCEKDQAELDELYDETQKAWTELFTLEIKTVS